MSYATNVDLSELMFLLDLKKNGVIAPQLGKFVRVIGSTNDVPKLINVAGSTARKRGL